MQKLDPNDIQLPFGLSPAKHRTRKPAARPSTKPPRKDERSDDIVIKSRPSPVKEKKKSIASSRIREFSDTEELEPIPMIPMTPIPPRNPSSSSRDRRKYEKLREEPTLEEQRIRYAALDELQRLQSDELQRLQSQMQRHALSTYADDRMDERRHREELDRQMYRDRTDERHHRERLEHSMMSHYAADRSADRQFELAKMRIEHAEPLAKANIMARQQSLLEQDAALDRHIRRTTASQ